MNEKITLPTLVTLLSNHSGVSKKQCEDFLREFFNVIVETVSEGENVRIKGLGAFKIIDVEPRKSVDVNTGQPIEIPGHRKIVFVPSKEIAEEINEPFAIFESVEIPDDAVDLEDEDETTESMRKNNIAPDSDNNNITGDAPHLSEEEYPNEDISSETKEERTELPEEIKTDHLTEYQISDKDQNTQDDQEVPDDIPVSDKTPEGQEANIGVNVNEESDTDEVSNSTEGDYPEDRSSADSELGADEVTCTEIPSKHNHRFVLGLLCGMLLMGLIGAALYFFLPNILNRSHIATVPASSVITDTIPKAKVNEVLKQNEASGQDTIVNETGSLESTISEKELPQEAEVPTAPSDSKPVYDTISKTRYLTTMAKEHYGNYNLWPYIYEENKKILGHPDRIKPGTKVVIPPLSKYGVNPSNPEDIRKAKQKGVEIYSRY